MRVRIAAIAVILFSLYIVVLVRLFYWQVVREADLRGIARAQSSDSIEFPARRGEILFKDGFPLATNKVSYLLYANPKIIKDTDLYAKKLAFHLDLSSASISAALSKDLFWVKLAGSVEVEKKKSIETLELKGLGFSEQSSRFYPEASMAAQLIGFAGFDEKGSQKGYFGLEGYYNSQLSGRDGRLFAIRDTLGNLILNDVREEKKLDGRNLHLSVDRAIQFIAEKELKAGIERYQAEGGSVIVMEPMSGKILSMASFPRFDPQKYYEFDTAYYRNPVISNLYEPGSTFKVLVMGAALDSSVVKPETKCLSCSGPIQIGEYKIKTWNEKYYPEASMTEVIQHSDNTGMVFVGQKLGLKKLLYYLSQFGIGELTNIDLQGEITGDLKSASALYPIDLATMSFGQGISVTPIQLITAVSSIANGGEIVTPYIVEMITTSDEKKIEIKPVKKRRVLSKTTSKILVELMVNAVENGEAKWTKLDKYKIAGKTGTAQIPIAGHYDPDQTIASFVGFFPADDPKVSMLVVVDRPKTRVYGSETAAPIFFSIARQVIQYLNIPPDR